MIYIERLSNPNWLFSDKVKEVYEEQRAYILGHAQDKKRKLPQQYIDLSQFTIPMTVEEEKTLVQGFFSKCPFCESLMTGADESYQTKEMAARQEELKALLYREEKGEQFKKGIHRGFSNKRINKSNEGFEMFDTGFFRPELRAMHTDGSVDPYHYWWLGWDWNNIFTICNACLTAKENKFPVRDNKRAAFPDQGLENIRSGLEKEEALLIDPCQQQDFEIREILFEDGNAIGVGEKGRQVVDVFALNRPKLLAVRQLVSRAKAKQIEEALHQAGAKPKLLSPAHPFVASSIDAWWLNTNQDQEALAHLEAIFEGELPAYIRKAVPESNTYTQKDISDLKDQNKASSYNLEKKENLDQYFTKSLWIEEIDLQNFKAFPKLKLKFPNVTREDNQSRPSTSMRRPWLALLGENGVGKSSISQALALALMGKKKLEDLDLDLNEFIRLGQKTAIVKVFLLNKGEPITLTINRTEEGKGTFTLSEETPQVLMMAYGASRLISNSKEILGADGDSFIRTSNLFNAYAQLGNGLAWLADKEKVPEPLFELLKEGLSNLLPLDEGKEITRDTIKGEVFVQKIEQEETEDQPIPFKYLSSGYRTVLAFTLDIMIGAAELISSLPNKEKYSLLDISGIVMIDEIGVHLHPSWKMRIAKMLKRTFPKMSFIITTHDPLCLRGLEAGEVVLLERDEDDVIRTITDLPSPAKMRVGQLLTSVFGLNTTMDPELEPQYTEYYHLLGLSNRTVEQEKRLDELEKNLKPDLMLGDTIQDRETYRVISEQVLQFKSDPNKPDISSVSGDILDDASNFLDEL